MFCEVSHWFLRKFVNNRFENVIQGNILQTVKFSIFQGSLLGGKRHTSCFAKWKNKDFTLTLKFQKILGNLLSRHLLNVDSRK